MTARKTTPLYEWTYSPDARFTPAQVRDLINELEAWLLANDPPAKGKS